MNCGITNFDDFIPLEKKQNVTPDPKTLEILRKNFDINDLSPKDLLELLLILDNEANKN